MRVIPMMRAFNAAFVTDDKNDLVHGQFLKNKNEKVFMIFFETRNIRKSSKQGQIWL